MLIGDCGRPGRGPFLETLRSELAAARAMARGVAADGGDMEAAIAAAEAAAAAELDESGLVDAARLEFMPVEGWYAGVPRNDLISPTSDEVCAVVKRTDQCFALKLSLLCTALMREPIS